MSPIWIAFLAMLALAAALFTSFMHYVAVKGRHYVLPKRTVVARALLLAFIVMLVFTALVARNATLKSILPLSLGYFALSTVMNVISGMFGRDARREKIRIHNAH